MNYKEIHSDIRDAYLLDNNPWVIGFSGGKDSTTIVQMLFNALSTLPKSKLSKELHVICNDTLVENPAIIKFVNSQLEKIKKAGKSVLFNHKPSLFEVVKLKPKLEDSFWVNLIGKGYPSPNRWFRWCTERLKINPTSEYILKTLKNRNKTIVVLGTRKAESGNRSASMTKYSNNSKFRSHRLSNVLVYTPIEDLNNNEVWAYLIQARNLLGINNKELLKMYGFACDSGECPFVIETGTQSCGKSRFGCWVCTVVDKDKSMENFINNGHAWMKGLLDFRNWLFDIRQQTNQYVPKYIDSRAKFGPFLLRTRNNIFKSLLRLQESLSIELISSEELEYIKNMLNFESECKVKNGMKRFVLKLPSSKYLAITSDFNILQSSRDRLGAYNLKNSKIVRSYKISQNYLLSSRVMYYEIEP